MDHNNRSWMTVAGLLVAGLFIVGLAVVTSKPFQEKMSGPDAAHEMATETAQEKPTEPTDEAPSEVADEKPAAMDAGETDVAEAAPADAAEEPAAEPADEPPSPTAEEEAAETKAEEAAAEEQAVEAKAEAEGAKEEAAAASEDLCCKPGDQTPPLELVKQVPSGGLHNPYDWKKLKEENEDPDYLVKQFRLPGCNECHGGGGGGGFCPALSQGVWFWGNTDDVLFRLIAQGSKALEEDGFERIQWGTVKAPMPEMGHVIRTSDHLWKIVSFIRSINPPGTNPPEKVIPGRWKAPEGKAAE